MRALLPFLRLFKFAKLPLFLGLVLMITGLASSIGLLTTSGWFLAATAIAGLGSLFNFFYPSASVRGLAIGRTLFRYFEKLVTHDATFRILAKLRVQVFEKIIPLSPGVLNRYRNSDLLNRLVSDVDTLDSLYLRLIAPFITAIFVILAMCIGLSFVNAPLALGLGASLLLLVFVIPTVFYQLGKKFGDKKYAKEELVAELTAATVSQQLGFDKHVTDNSAMYLSNWVKALKEEPKFIYTVLSEVGKAQGLIMAGGGFEINDYQNLRSCSFEPVSVQYYSVDQL